MLKAVASAAEDDGYTTALINAGEEPPDGRRLMRSLTAHSFDGPIVWESPWSDQAKTILPETVIVSDGDQPDDAAVFISSPQIVRSAMHHLVELGHRRIARLGFDLPAAPFRARARAFRDCLLASDFQTGGELEIEESFGSTSSLQMTALLAGQNRPTAVICDDDLLAPLVYRAAKEAGLRIPEDVSVVGIGDIDLAQLLEPQLTTVAIPAQSVGEAAFAALLQKIHGGAIEMPIIVETHLIVRASSAPPAA